MSDNAEHVIFGTGPLGMALMRELVRRGKRVRMVNRSGTAPQGMPAGVRVEAGDAMDAASARTRAEGASVVYQCVNAPYHEWVEKFPPMNTNILNAATAVNAKLVVAENVYMYGDPNGKPITKDLPVQPHTRKGRVRAAMSREVMDAQASGKVRAAIARASDFYGPGVLGSTHGDRVFGFAVQGKPCDVLGNPDLPHSVTYIEDFGKALATLGERDESMGRVWHVPSGKPISQREFVDLIFEELGQPPTRKGRVRRVSKTMLRLAGLFIPAARESVEMSYEFEKPFVLDATKFIRAYGDIATPHREGVRATVAWYKRKG